jgi:Cu2+-containing amine oxidase
VSVQAAQFTSKQYMIKHAGLTDIFVPYDDGSSYFYDMSSGPGRNEILDSDLAGASLSTAIYLRTFVNPNLNPPPNNLTPCSPFNGCYVRDDVKRVAVECRETGIAWLCKQTEKKSRRMHEIIVWGVSDAGNYDNIIEYRFREDGSIGFRYGATGYNNPGQRGASHMHDGIWRVSTKLFNRTDNEVWQFQHELKTGGKTAEDSDVPITTEGSTKWKPKEFSNLVVRSTSQLNHWQHQMGYEVIPWNRTGTARHSSDEQWALNDFHVTNDNPGEDGFGDIYPNNWRFIGWKPDEYLSTYLNNETVGATGDGIVIWYISPAHHEPSDLDSPDYTKPENAGFGEYAGVTPVHWSGFDLEPHNLFDWNPLGGPHNCGLQ